jgi:hypothetical protein
MTIDVKSTQETPPPQGTSHVKEPLPPKDRPDKSVEISKAVIGCIGTVVVAIITGIFALITTLGPRLPIFAVETKTAATAAPPVVVVVMPTPLPVVLATFPPSQSTTPRSSNIVFGPIFFSPGLSGIEPNKKPVDPAVHFPEGTIKVYSVFSYEGTIAGSQWRWDRSLNGKLQPELAGVGIDLNGKGNTWVALWQESGIPAGDWELRLYVDDRIVQKASFSIDKHPPSAAYFGPIRFAENIKDDVPVNMHKANENFKAGTKQVYAFFDMYNMTKDLKYKREWYRDGQAIPYLTKTETWTSGPTEKDWWTMTNSDSGLTSGTYELKLYLDDQLVQLGTFVIE